MSASDDAIYISSDSDFGAPRTGKVQTMAFVPEEVKVYKPKKGQLFRPIRPPKQISTQTLEEAT